MKIRRVIFAAVVASGAAPVAAAAGSSQPGYVTDAAFPVAFDMYWRARLVGAAAGSRACALPNKAYDDPKSPYRPVNERLDRAEAKFEARFPGALNTVARPYQMPPPQSLCDDAKAAWEAIFAFETAVVGLENLLDFPGRPK